MKDERVSAPLRCGACLVLLVCICLAHASEAWARNTIQWEDDQGVEQSIDIQDLGPYERRIQEEMARHKAEQSATGEQIPGPAGRTSKSEGEQLTQEYDAIKAQQEQQKDIAQHKQQLASVNKQIQEIDTQMQEVQRLIQVGKQRRGRTRGRIGKRHRLSTQITALEEQYASLASQKKNLEEQRDTLQRWKPAPVTAPSDGPAE